MATKKYNQHTRATFVRKAVKEIPLTTAIIDAIMPYYPKSCICIAGYLDSSDQFWKVNYHWEYLVNMIDKSLEKSMSEKHQTCARAIRKVLMANSPSPRTGYTASSKVGSPKDNSSNETITKRWATLKQSKRDFKSIIDAAGLLAKNPPSKKAWHLSVAPVAKPGTSKHGSGYAVDISGSNQTIKTISKALGATMTFDEKSHVHVEFKNGVKVDGYAPPKTPTKEANSVPAPSSSPLSTEETNDLMCVRPDDVSGEVGSYEVLVNDVLNRAGRTGQQVMSWIDSLM